MRKGYVYDYETIVNCFIAIFVDLQNPKNVLVFQISPWKNDYHKLKAFLNQCIINGDSMISFNGLQFDNQISQFILDPNQRLEFSRHMHREIYEFAQYTIKAEKKDLKYRKHQNPFRERDVLQINNYDNPQKRTSLKWLQFSMNWPNLEDMPIPHDVPITQDQVPKVIKYCYNDCLSTRQKFLLDKEEVLLRDTLTEVFQEDLLSASEPQISKTLFAKALAQNMGISIKELNRMRTERKFIDLSEVILDKISFKDPVLQRTLRDFKNTKVSAEDLKGSFKKKVMYKGVEVSYALGGIHGAKKGIHVSDEDCVIMSFDVVSFYPNLAIKNRWAPAHLPVDTFVNTYEGLFFKRREYPKGHPLNYTYKIVLNSAYGLSNEQHGNFMKDPMFTMKITVNGQLLLTMLMEDLVENIPGSMPLMYNTDGGEIKIPRKYMQTFYDVCKKWEEFTKLELEYESYSKLIIADVNSYIGVYNPVVISKEDAIAQIKKARKKNEPDPLIKRSRSGEYLLFKTKCKGRYVIYPEMHKNKSFPIVPKMLYNYFVHGIAPEKTIENCTDIMDYVGAVRAKGECKLTYKTLNVNTGAIEERPLQKTNRYYISPSGGKIIKNFEKSVEKVSAFPAYETLLNIYDKNRPFETYELSKPYYLNRFTSELKSFNTIQLKQHDLFT